MKQKLKSLRLRMLLPVIGMTLFTVILLTALFTRAYTKMILQQENEVNEVGFETISSSITPLIETSISKARSILADDRAASYARLQYDSVSKLIHARIDCRDYLSTEIERSDGIYGLLFMRTDESLFGVLPEGPFFRDDPAENPLPQAMKAKILGAPLGQTVWVGLLAASTLYGFEREGMSQSVMIAAWKSVDVRYGECYTMMLMDESIFDRLFAALQDGKSRWRLFAEDQTEFYHTGSDACRDAARLIRQSNSGGIFRDENDRPVCAFSMTLAFPEWTLVREVSMEGYEEVIRRVRRDVWHIAGVVFLIALVLYQLWLRGFMRQFNALLKGIIRMGEGDLEPGAQKPFSIGEFDRMRLEIDRTSLALNRQMDTIRRMEREQMEAENRKKEQERIEQELNMAREIQESTLPHAFPSFPDRAEFSLYASMTPAKEVGGDFYDFFLIDSDHLALVIADVSGKGIPAALFMMTSKTLINNHLMTGCDPATALERVNRQLCQNNTSKMFVTVWLAVLELSTGKGLAVNAGHENPGLRRMGGRFELLAYRHNMFIGVSQKAKYVNRPFELNPGDSLFVYTDGVPEANDRNEEMFGTQRLEAALNQDPGATPERLIENVHAVLNDFTQDAPQFDDVTMLSLKYHGSGGARVDF